MSYRIHILGIPFHRLWQVKRSVPRRSQPARSCVKCSASNVKSSGSALRCPDGKMGLPPWRMWLKVGKLYKNPMKNQRNYDEVLDFFGGHPS